MIDWNGKSFKTLSNEIYMGDKKIIEIYMGDKKIYPESSERYIGKWIPIEWTYLDSDGSSNIDGFSTIDVDNLIIGDNYIYYLDDDSNTFYRLNKGYRTWEKVNMHVEIYVSSPAGNYKTIVNFDSFYKIIKINTESYAYRYNGASERGYGPRYSVVKLNEEDLTWYTDEWNNDTRTDLNKYPYENIWKGYLNNVESYFNGTSKMYNPSNHSWEDVSVDISTLPYFPDTEHLVWCDEKLKTTYYSVGTRNQQFILYSLKWYKKNDMFEDDVREVVGNDVWSDGENIYYLNKYIFDNVTQKWSKCIFDTSETDGFSYSGYHFPIWTDGNNIYFSNKYVLVK